ncbi:MAG: NAD(+)/NADH kinase [Clostridiales bacterium]|jgi:NAD+ kinase|nr:NAD(+)/NADH kinase [Clostridiales bacterium]
MLKIGIIPNLEKGESVVYTKRLYDAIVKYKAKAITTDKTSVLIEKDLNKISDDNELINESDILVSIGGDGTFLGVARNAWAQDKPVLGLNLGTLGFLTEVDKNSIEGTVQSILNNEYSIDERMLLDISVTDFEGSELFNDSAMNDVVISRANISRIIYLKMYINGAYADTYTGDGLIVATPTGSTAYSMSAGGPIVEPGNEVILITPICSHSLNAKPIVASGNSRIELSLHDASFSKVMVTVDGRDSYTLNQTEYIYVKKSDKKVKIVRLAPSNFYYTLRERFIERSEKLKDSGR